MTNHQKFQRCLLAATIIVAKYRADAPQGFDPKNTWVAIGVGVAGVAVSAGTAAYSANQSKKAAGKLKAAPYHPIDFTADQRSAINANADALPDINRLVRGTNSIITTDALTRAKKLIPGYMDSMSKYGNATGSLLNGQLPYDDVLGIVGNQSNLSGELGVPGTAAPATLRDLGISRMQAIQSGGGMLNDMVNIAEKISPRGGYMNPQSSMISPSQRIQLDMEQAALEQQSAQSGNNVAAQQAQQNAQANAALATSIGNSVNSLGGQFAGAYNTGQGGLNGGLNSYTGYYRSPADVTKAFSYDNIDPNAVKVGGNNGRFYGYYNN